MNRRLFREHGVITIQTEELLSSAIAAKRIGVSTERILQLVHAKILPATKVLDGWRGLHVFTSEDVAAYATARARKASTK